MRKDTILVADDEPSIVELLVYNLGREGYDVAAAADGPETLRVFADKKPSLVILDISMPGMDGFDVCREIRKVSDVPIIMLTARNTETNKVVGLELGADDYVTKPFSVAELMARVKANLRRAEAGRGVADGNSPANLITRGDFSMDRDRREVKVGGAKADLTTKEFDLLWLLASRPGVVFSRQRILDIVWGGEACVVDRAIDVHVRHVREKLDAASPGGGGLVNSVRGVGYRFEEPGGSR
ncbi:MAG TPA: response regulator transcription factor [bacterium]|nr:response regulator transcription factor [bacterium]